MPGQRGISGFYSKRRLTAREIRCLTTAPREFVKLARQYAYSEIAEKDPKLLRLTQLHVECRAELETNLDTRLLWVAAEGSACDEDYVRNFAGYRFVEADELLSAFCAAVERQALGADDKEPEG